MNRPFFSLLLYLLIIIVFPINAKVDTKRVVGEIAMVSGVDKYGAKTYEVPLNIPESGNSLKPELSLYYNSHQGVSTLGMGWSLKGVSSITRCPKNIYYDGFAEGICFTNDDAFQLDGMRLIRLEDNSPGGYILYETESGNIKVKGYVSNSALTGFEVFYPDGKRGLFGEPDKWNNRVVYPIVCLEDLHGNKINYSYRYFADTDGNDAADSPTEKISGWVAGQLHSLSNHLTELCSKILSPKTALCRLELKTKIWILLQYTMDLIIQVP